MRMNLDLRAWYDSVPKAPPVVPQKPPTSIWDPGALLTALVDGERLYGKVVELDPHVDYVLVHVHTSGANPVSLAWAGKRSAFQSMWSFAHHIGAA